MMSMFLAGQAPDIPGLGFLVLVASIACIVIIARLAGGPKPDRESKPAAGPEPAHAPAPAPGRQAPAPGSLGECELFRVDDKTAAMLMAIVADELKAPLNELRFIAIKEVEEEVGK